MLFTLYPGPGSWKSNILLPVNECSLINNVTPMTEFSGTSPLMAAVDRQASATGAVQLQPRICHPLKKFVLEVLFRRASCIWQLVHVSVCVTGFFFWFFFFSSR